VTEQQQQQQQELNFSTSFGSQRAEIKCWLLHCCLLGGMVARVPLEAATKHPKQEPEQKSFCTAAPAVFHHNP